MAWPFARSRPASRGYPAWDEQDSSLIAQESEIPARAFDLVMAHRKIMPAIATIGACHEADYHSVCRTLDRDCSSHSGGLGGEDRVHRPRPRCLRRWVGMESHLRHAF